jgi:hypothetical protein
MVSTGLTVGKTGKGAIGVPVLGRGDGGPAIGTGVDTSTGYGVGTNPGNGVGTFTDHVGHGVIAGILTATGGEIGEGVTGLAVTDTGDCVGACTTRGDGVGPALGEAVGRKVEESVCPKLGEGVSPGEVVAEVGVEGGRKGWPLFGKPPGSDAGGLIGFGVDPTVGPLDGLTFGTLVGTAIG